jgi:hypothetical protein
MLSYDESGCWPWITMCDCLSPMYINTVYDIPFYYMMCYQDNTIAICCIDIYNCKDSCDVLARMNSAVTTEQIIWQGTPRRGHNSMPTELQFVKSDSEIFAQHVFQRDPN